MQEASGPDDAVAVLRRFAYPLPAHPGFVALYSVIRDASSTHLQWDGIRGASRIPAEYSGHLREQQPTSVPSDQHE